MLPAVSRKSAQCRGRDDTVLVIAEHPLKLLVVLYRSLCPLVHRRQQLGGVSGTFGRLARRVQQYIVSLVYRVGESTVGFALSATGALGQRFHVRRCGQGWLCAPRLQERQKVQVPLRVHRVRDAVPGLQLIGMQVGVDPVGHRSEYQLRRPIGECDPEPAALHLAVANLAEFAGEPFQFVVDVSDC